MHDSLGREIDYIRISVTDRCNLRCIYCMPEEGIQLISHEEILSYDEILRICRIFAANGIRFFRITGGEPLLRRDITSLIKGIKEMAGVERVTLTTNGVLLRDMMEGLAVAGVDSINVSLDSTNRAVYEEMTRRDELQRVLDGIEAAAEFKIPLKINCVAMCTPHRTLHDELARIQQVAELARNRAIDVRFIEVMPIGYGKDQEYLGEEEIQKMLEKEYGTLIPCEGVIGNGPCHYYTVNGFTGRIGFISAISHKFCDTCNRIRLTPQGFLKACLQYDIGADLRELLRNGTSDEAISETIQQVIQAKPDGHQFQKAHVDRSERSCMSQIGG